MIGQKLCNNFYSSKKMADDYTSSNSTAAEASVQAKVVGEAVNPHDYRCWEMFRAYRQCICELSSLHGLFLGKHIYFP